MSPLLVWEAMKGKDLLDSPTTIPAMCSFTNGRLIW